MTIDNILEGIKEKASKVSPIGNTLKFDFGGSFVYIDGTGDANVVTNDDKRADCLVSVSPEHFESLIKGDMNPMMAVMTGKIKIKGDMGVAMKLQSLI